VYYSDVQTRRLSLFGRKRVSQNVAVVLPPPQKKKMVSLPSKVLNTNKNSESVHFYNIMVAQQAGGDFDVVDRERF